MAKKGIKRLNSIIEREFRKHMPIKVMREWRDDVEHIYVMLGDTRYRMAEDGMGNLFFTALGQPALTFPLPEDYTNAYAQVKE